MILSKNTSSNKIILYFVYFYLAIFGPKIGGFIDISAIINLLTFLFVITNNKGKLILKDGIIEVIMPVLILFLYTLILTFFTKDQNIVFMFKLMRALLATHGISAFIERKKEDCFVMLDVLENVCSELNYDYIDIIYNPTEDFADKLRECGFNAYTIEPMNYRCCCLLDKSLVFEYHQISF